MSYLDAFLRSQRPATEGGLTSQKDGADTVSEVPEVPKPSTSGTSGTGRSGRENEFDHAIAVRKVLSFPPHLFPSLPRPSALVVDLPYGREVWAVHAEFRGADHSVTSWCRAAGGHTTVRDVLSARRARLVAVALGRAGAA